VSPIPRLTSCQRRGLDCARPPRAGTRRDAGLLRGGGETGGGFGSSKPCVASVEDQAAPRPAAPSTAAGAVRAGVGAEDDDPRRGTAGRTSTLAVVDGQHDEAGPRARRRRHRGPRTSDEFWPGSWRRRVGGRRRRISVRPARRFVVVGRVCGRRPWSRQRVRAGPRRRRTTEARRVVGGLGDAARRGPGTRGRRWSSVRPRPPAREQRGCRARVRVCRTCSEDRGLRCSGGGAPRPR